MISRILCLLVGVCMLSDGLPSARADLDPEATTPYKLRIVLHFSSNSVMTDVFQKKVAQDLRDSLQADLGDLAVVEVVSDHRLLKDILEHGLQHVLDSWKSISPMKTHFVLIDYAQGQYHITARQHDGTTGLASPVVRREQTDDRLLVAKTAAILVKQDFGIVGTIQAAGDLKSAKTMVAIKAGGRGASLDGWVQKGDIFAVAEIVGQPDGPQRSYRRPWTLLQVAEQPKDGVCVCKPLSRYQEWPPPQIAGSQGLRCLKLGTVEGKLKIRLVDDKQAIPLNRLQVAVSGKEFGGQGEQHSTAADGIVQTEGTFKNLAFVTITDGGRVLAIPVEIVDDHTVVCTIKSQHAGERLGQLGIRWDAFLRRLDDERMLVDRLYRELERDGAMTEKQWFERGSAGLKDLRAEILSLTSEREQIAKERDELAKDPKIARGDLPEFTAADQLLHGLEARRDSLDGLVKEMDKQIKSGVPEQRDKWRAQALKAEALEKRGEYPQAIAIYEKIVAEGSKDKAVEKRLATLKQNWEPKNQQHREAREFIYNEWPLCTTAKKMKDKLEEANKAFAVCKANGDYISARKLFLVNQDHLAQLRREVDVLKGDNEDDRAMLELIKTLDLDSLIKRVVEFVKNEPAPKPAN